MEVVNFKKSGDPILVKFVVKNGVLAVAYQLKLSNKNSNIAVLNFDGDNQNSGDDSYYLPTPVDENNERILRLSADFYGLDLDMIDKFSMGLEIYQGNNFIKYVEKTGELGPDAQNILLFAHSGDIVPVIPEHMVPLFHDVSRVKLVKIYPFNFFLFRSDSPLSSILCDEYTSLSKIASAIVPSPIVSCQLATGI